MRITHPRPTAGRSEDFGVAFVDGIATVESLHPERERALLQHGFTLEADLDVAKPYHPKLGAPILDLTALTKKQLQAIADDEGVEIPSRATHAEMVDILSRRPAAATPGAVTVLDGTMTIEGDFTVDGSGPFATLKLPDGTVLGDGSSIVELRAEDASEG